MAHTVEETTANLSHLQNIIEQMSGMAASPPLGGQDGGEGVNGDDARDAMSSVTGTAESLEDLQSKVTQLEEMLKTLEYHA